MSYEHFVYYGYFLEFILKKDLLGENFLKIKQFIMANLHETNSKNYKFLLRKIELCIVSNNTIYCIKISIQEY